VPIYRYECPTHGRFDAFCSRQTAAEEDPGAQCKASDCAEVAPRLFTTQCLFYLNGNAATQKTGWHSPGMSGADPNYKAQHTAMRRTDGSFQDGRRT